MARTTRTTALLLIVLALAERARADDLSSRYELGERIHDRVRVEESAPEDR